MTSPTKMSIRTYACIHFKIHLLFGAYICLYLLFTVEYLSLPKSESDTSLARRATSLSDALVCQECGSKNIVQANQRVRIIYTQSLSTLIKFIFFL